MSKWIAVDLDGTLAEVGRNNMGGIGNAGGRHDEPCQSLAE
ncbi:hypothetical protein [Aquitalea sp. FJL05]|nr:hypothetical protein [Aquitalea sp. FJL05]